MKNIFFYIAVTLCVCIKSSEESSDKKTLSHRQIKQEILQEILNTSSRLSNTIQKENLRRFHGYISDISYKKYALYDLPLDDFRKLLLSAIVKYGYDKKIRLEFALKRIVESSKEPSSAATPADVYSMNRLRDTLQATVKKLEEKTIRSAETLLVSHPQIKSIIAPIVKNEGKRDVYIYQEAISVLNKYIKALDQENG